MSKSIEDFSELIHHCESSEVTYDIDDQRVSGKLIDVEFYGALVKDEEIALEHMLKHDMGIMQMATGTVRR